MGGPDVAHPAHGRACSTPRAYSRPMKGGTWTISSAAANLWTIPPKSVRCSGGGQRSGSGCGQPAQRGHRSPAEAVVRPSSEGDERDMQARRHRALAEGWLGQAGLVSHRPAAVPRPRSSFAGFRFPPEVIILALRWYLRYGLSYRDVEELLAERGIAVDHVTIYRWVQRFTPELIDAARPSLHVAGDRWFVDETYLKVCWAVGVPVPGDRPARAGHRCPRLTEAGSGGNPPVLRPGTERGATADRGDHRPGAGLPAGARRADARGVARGR